MPTNQETPSAPRLRTPTVAQLLLYLLLLGWLIAAPVAVGLTTLSLPTGWPQRPVAVLLLAGLLVGVIAAFWGLVRWRGWVNMRPALLALAVTILYILVAVSLRALTGPPGYVRHFPWFSESSLRLVVLTPAALLIGGVGLWWAGVPRSLLGHAFGLDRPSLAGLLVALAALALLTLGWPLTGALGDSWVSLFILLQALALALPEELIFRGAVIGIFTYNFQQRKALAAMLAIFTYVAFTPSMLVPRNEWASLVLLLTALPFALLLTELRALTGSIWAGLLFATFYRAAPRLFTDPRVELPLITEPWQTAAYVWMIVGAGGLALALWGGRRWLASGWRFSGPAALGLALVPALLAWGVWTGLWFGLGYPGFYNDGFLIIMEQQADLAGAEQIADLAARRAFVREQLMATAAESQAPVRQALEEAGLAYRPFYLVNMVAVEGHHRRMGQFATLPGVAEVMLNPNVRPYPAHRPTGYGQAVPTEQEVAWNISQVEAPDLWEMGIRGQGIVVAGQDTGYDWEHPALRRAYRGYRDDGQASHAYNWYDAWDDSPIPFDDDHHGTHTMGTILGHSDQGSQIGMAPDARWIGCRNMRRGIGNPASYTACMEFFLAPYPPGGDPFTDGDTAQAPHLVNNSWGCPDFEGCDDDVLEPGTAALRAAGIMMVVSAGNEGPGCRTVAEPPARYDNVFTVGAVSRSSHIVGFSSRGPVSGLLKPDIVAPGADIRSSISGGGYGLASGTSMAGPHVAGLVALLWSANPELIGQVDRTEEIIRRSADPLEVVVACSPEQAQPEEGLIAALGSLAVSNPCGCGGVTGHPNNIYGWGEINSLAAVELARQED